MDKEILEILKRLESKIDKMEQEQTKTNERLNNIETKLDGVVEQTVNLTEFKTDAIEKLDKLINVTKDNCYEISNLKIVK